MGNRMMDPALMCYHVPDRFAEKFPWQSPYVQAVNNPMRFVDFNGDSIWVTIHTPITNAYGTSGIKTDRYYYGSVNGTNGFIGSSGNLYSGDDKFVNSLSSALNSIQTGGTAGNTLVNDLMTSTNNVEVAYGRNNADPNGNYIHWNPNSTNGGIDANGNTSRPSFIGLGHEMAHIQDAWKGTYDNSTWVTANGVNVSNSEKYATHIENQLRSENGILLRTHYVYDVSTGVPVGSESTRIVSGCASVFYSQPAKIYKSLLHIPFIY
jgi:hypothetical protein